MSAVSDDPAHAYKVLRNESAAMLQLDPADLSPISELKLDLVTLLRLALDNLSGLALSGQEIDLQRLSACHVMLSKLLPQAVEPSPSEPNFDGAAEQFASLIAQRADALEARRVHLRDLEVEGLRAQLAARDATIERLTAATPQPAAPSSPPLASASAQTSSQPPLRSSSSPFARRDGGIIEGRFGPKDWSNRN